MTKAVCLAALSFPCTNITSCLAPYQPEEAVLFYTHYRARRPSRITSVQPCVNVLNEAWV